MEDRKALLNKIMHVHHFHETFQIGNADAPTLINERDYTLRYNLIKEENEEYLDACKNGDIVEIADVYILDDPLSAVDAKVARKIFDDAI